MSLKDDFEKFKDSPEAKKPAFEVREDWREWQLEQAILNGDLEADLHPNTEFEASWAEPEEEEPPEGGATMVPLRKTPNVL